MTEEVQWWGYIHIDGSVHARMYFDMRDVREAEASDFVKQVFGPIEGTRKDIIKVMKENK